MRPYVLGDHAVVHEPEGDGMLMDALPHRNGQHESVAERSHDSLVEATGAALVVISDALVNTGRCVQQDEDERCCREIVLLATFESIFI